MDMPHAVTFGPDGNGDGKLDLYVGDRREDGTGGRIARFDAVTGAFLGDFIALGSGGLDHPLAHVFGPDANGAGAQDLYVTDEHAFSIRHYNGVTGAFLGDFVPAGSGGLAVPFPLVFGPDGNLYVGDLAGLGSGPVLRYHVPASATPGAFMDVFIPPDRGGMRVPLSGLFGPDRNGDGHQELYVGNAASCWPSAPAQRHPPSRKSTGRTNRDGGKPYCSRRGSRDPPHAHRRAASLVLCVRPKELNFLFAFNNDMNQG
jgi:hypothetical protein